jgi:diketogulonate reductase-like aldo/keto reductase
MKMVSLPSGEQVPALGQGTLKMGATGGCRSEQIAALRLGLDLGMTVVDTAESYANGDVEEIVGEAIIGRRDEIFLVSKVYPPDSHLIELSRSIKSFIPPAMRALVPHSIKARANSVLRKSSSRPPKTNTDLRGRTLQSTVAACERSLRRLRTDRLDLYLLHWRGATPLDETLMAFHDLVQAGKIRYFGVSNFGTRDLEEWWTLGGADGTATNQVGYNLSRRDIEEDVLPWCQHHNLPIMAHSPLDQGRLMANHALQRIAVRLRVPPSQVALAWLVRQGGVIAIPQATRQKHVRENYGALGIELAPNDLMDLELAFAARRIADT